MYHPSWCYAMPQSGYPAADSVGRATALHVLVKPLKTRSNLSCLLTFMISWKKLIIQLTQME